MGGSGGGGGKGSGEDSSHSHSQYLQIKPCPIRRVDKYFLVCIRSVS